VEPRSNNAIAAGLSSFTGHDPPPEARRRPASVQAKATSKLRPKDRPLQNDFLTADAEFARSSCGAWFGTAARVLLPGRRLLHLGAATATSGTTRPPSPECGLYFSPGNRLVTMPPRPHARRKDFMGAFEIAFYGWKEGAGPRVLWAEQRDGSLGSEEGEPAVDGFTSRRSRWRLSARAILYSSRKGEHVLDLFGGSGFDA